MTIVGDVFDLEQWYSSPETRCKCGTCLQYSRFAENYFAFRDGAEFRTEMLKGLTEAQHKAFIKLICMRNLEEKKP